MGNVQLPPHQEKQPDVVDTPNQVKPCQAKKPDVVDAPNQVKKSFWDKQRMDRNHCYFRTFINNTEIFIPYEERIEKVKDRIHDGVYNIVENYFDDNHYVLKLQDKTGLLFYFHDPGKYTKKVAPSPKKMGNSQYIIMGNLRSVDTSWR